MSCCGRRGGGGAGSAAALRRAGYEALHSGVSASASALAGSHFSAASSLSSAPSLFDYAPVIDPVSEQLSSSSSSGAAGSGGVHAQQSSVVAVFSVHFDTHRGNVLECCWPSDVDLEGVEFAAMAAGQHQVEEDYLFFVRRQLFGLSCFHRAVAGKEERGARMRCVGVLVRHFSDLRGHMEFCRLAARRMNASKSDGERMLAEYYDEHRDRDDAVPEPRAADLCRYPFVGESHGTLLKLFDRYGVRLFTIWRALLLRKRVLFGFTPPMGNACDVVYACCHLRLATDQQALNRLGSSNPLFHVKLDDIPTMASLDTYIACTSELVFRDKQQLYDVFGEQTTVVVSPGVLPETRQALVENDMDHLRFQLLDRYVQSVAGSGPREAIIRRFFTALTNQLFSLLASLEMSNDRADVTEWGPWWGVPDEPFIARLCRVYRMQVSVGRGSCACCCRGSRYDEPL